MGAEWAKIHLPGNEGLRNNKMKLKPVKSPHVKIAIGWAIGITAGLYSFILVRDMVIDRQREEMKEKRRIMREQKAKMEAENEIAKQAGKSAS